MTPEAIPMEDTIRCNQCGGISPADGRFCIECGAALPTVRADARPAPPPIVVAPPLPPPMHRPARHSPHGHGRAPDLTAPLAIIMVALALLFVPRFGAPAIMAIGFGGLLMRGLATRPERVLPILVLLGFLALLFTGSKLFWPALIMLFVLRAVFRGRPF
jgi:hypothetical protein